MSSSPAVILQRALVRRQKAQRGFSLRQVAARLDVSPSFLSGVLTGKKRLPISSLEPIARALDMDAIAVERLKDSLVREALPPSLRSALRRRLHAPATEPAHRELPKTDYPVLSQWYFLAILDLTTCEDFRPDPAWIARRLGLGTIQARQGWNILLQLGCLREEGGTWRKKLDHVRFPTRSSESTVRAYHAQVLSLAREELNRTADSDFAKRFIGGGTVAVNPAQIPAAKLRLQEALAEITDILSRGPCTEVYQVHASLFSLTRPEES